MSVISYSQNLEDIMLWRALKDIDNGFYIDIGANHPSIDSVTKLFYDMGWTGINVEPEREYYNLLVADRKKDINLNVAINSSGHPIELYISNVRGWSTTDKDGLTNLKEKKSLKNKALVPGMTLDELCDKYVSGDVHFLKIDVEGSEKDVLEGFSFNKFRPWIIVIEATRPTTQIDVSNNWDGIVYKNNYDLVYFDGLNKFYVAEEKRSLLIDKFRIPPNIFDDYIHFEQYEAIVDRDAEVKKTKVVTDKLNEVNSRLSETEEKLRLAEANIEVFKNKIESIMNSSSWKITSPLRYIFGKLKK